MSILVVAAHPDDEVLGAGCAIAAHADRGEAVHILIMAAGLDSRGEAATTSAHDRLKEQARAAALVLGARSVAFLDFPDNAMDTVGLLHVVKPIEAMIEQTSPHTVYTHSASDLNIDHKITARAVMTAARPLPGASVKRILAIEVPSATGWDAHAAPFQPNTFLDASNTLARKLAAMECYPDELRSFPHARSLRGIKARAVSWGAQVGMPAAEPYQLLRNLQP
ncbi:MAG TPA: GlcNAc-PI de-N-acetylase [Alphaproteobacteria bacterium]|nr:GlcNAc-PI de-N-acetylase [Alphaproteobacteria bacterium]HAJ47191.1 GlcNAc-PI de-N-acetylase [Alphaproteobacteria bacterium]